MGQVRFGNGNIPVQGDFIRGQIIDGNKAFRLFAVMGKSISLGYWNDMDKAKLGELIEELKEVHSKLQ